MAHPNGSLSAQQLKKCSAKKPQSTGSSVLSFLRAGVTSASVRHSFTTTASHFPLAQEFGINKGLLIPIGSGGLHLYRLLCFGWLVFSVCIACQGDLPGPCVLYWLRVTYCLCAWGPSVKEPASEPSCFASSLQNDPTRNSDGKCETVQGETGVGGRASSELWGWLRTGRTAREFTADLFIGSGDREDLTWVGVGRG